MSAPLAGLEADHLRAAGFETTAGVGKTGVVGVLRNGDGPVVMLRADMDALPVSEATGLAYASQVHGVMHACGHDMHVSWLAGDGAALANHCFARAGGGGGGGRHRRRAAGGDEGERHPRRGRHLAQRAHL